MKKMFSILFIILPVFVLGINVRDSVFVKIVVKKSNIITRMDIYILINSNLVKSFKIPAPKSLNFGNEIDMDADCSFEVLEIFNKKEKIIVSNADYQYINLPKDYLILNKGRKLKYVFNLNNLYSFKKGRKYRIRLRFKLSKYTIHSDIFSNWLNI